MPLLMFSGFLWPYGGAPMLRTPGAGPGSVLNFHPRERTKTIRSKQQPSGTLLARGHSAPQNERQLSLQSWLPEDCDSVSDWDDCSILSLTPLTQLSGYTCVPLLPPSRSPTLQNTFDTTGHSRPYPFHHWLRCYRVPVSRARKITYGVSRSSSAYYA
jgi:hypothetical protein